MCGATAAAPLASSTDISLPFPKRETGDAGLPPSQAKQPAKAESSLEFRLKTGFPRKIRCFGTRAGAPQP